MINWIEKPFRITYKSAKELFNKKGKTLDFGAGEGLGAKEINADTFEPYAKNWKPDYNKSSDIPTESYENITSLNVLNVMPKEERAKAVSEISRILKDIEKLEKKVYNGSSH